MTRGTVLVVDDDLEVVTVLAEALLDADYASLTAVTAHEALQVASDALPDAIVLDLTMPGMDGAELSRRLRADPRTTTIPLSAMAATAHLLVSAMPVDDRLATPVDLADLSAIIARWVRP